MYIKAVGHTHFIVRVSTSRPHPQSQHPSELHKLNRKSESLSHNTGERYNVKVMEE